jgi:hypothetical protein
MGLADASNASALFALKLLQRHHCDLRRVCLRGKSEPVFFYASVLPKE